MIPDIEVKTKESQEDGDKKRKNKCERTILPIKNT